MAATTLHGFAVVNVTRQGLNYSAVSDVDVAELQRFAQLVQAPLAQAPAR